MKNQWWKTLFRSKPSVTFGGFAMVPALNIPNKEKEPETQYRTPGPWKVSLQIKELNKDQTVAYTEHSTFIASEYMRNGVPYYMDRYIGHFQDPDNAVFVVRAVNYHDKLIYQLKKAVHQLRMRKDRTEKEDETIATGDKLIAEVSA